MTRNGLLIIPGSTAKVGLWRPGTDEPLIWRSVANDRQYGPNLLRAIEAILAEADITVRDVADIGVWPGPGSYTQIRLAVATANALAWSLNEPIFSLPNDRPTADEVAEAAASAKRNRPIEPIYPSEIE